MSMLRLRKEKGFTLIELMIVVAIIGILAAIAIPQFAQLISKSQEGATKGNLGAIRSALSIYYGDTEGRYPERGTAGAVLAPLTYASKYMNTVPSAQLPRTTNNGQGHSTTNAVAGGVITGVGDSGGWLYDNGPTSPSWGAVVTQCTHSDLRGTIWTAY